MTPTKLLIGQILVVFAIVIASVWFATEWCAAELNFQAQLGAPWFVVLGLPIYRPWQLFAWWFWYDAYAPAVFNKAGAIAASTFLSDPQRSFAHTLRRMMGTNHLGTSEHPRVHPVVASAAREVLNKSENERSGVLSTAMSFLAFSSNDERTAKRISDALGVVAMEVVPPGLG